MIPIIKLPDFLHFCFGILPMLSLLALSFFLAIYGIRKMNKAKLLYSSDDFPEIEPFQPTTQFIHIRKRQHGKTNAGIVAMARELEYGSKILVLDIGEKEAILIKDRLKEQEGVNAEYYPNPRKWQTVQKDYEVYAGTDWKIPETPDGYFFKLKPE